MPFSASLRARPVVARGARTTTLPIDLTATRGASMPGRLHDLVLILLGALAALPLVRYTLGKRRRRIPVAAGLVVAALVYVGFALLGGADLHWTLIELGGVLLFGTFAHLGLRRSVHWLAAGWALHVAWDVVLHADWHGHTVGTAFTPSWYPPLCLGFDLVLAAFVLRSVR